MMARYLKFAAGFWMSAFLVAGSFALMTTAKAKRKGLAGRSAQTGRDKHMIPELQRSRP
jgi:hypothetical protein